MAPRRDGQMVVQHNSASCRVGSSRPIAISGIAGPNTHVTTARRSTLPSRPSCLCGEFPLLQTPCMACRPGIARHHATPSEAPVVAGTLHLRLPRHDVRVRCRGVQRHPSHRKCGGGAGTSVSEDFNMTRLIAVWPKCRLDSKVVLSSRLRSALERLNPCRTGRPLRSPPPWIT